MENWAREFQRFCPDIDVQTYYGSLTERAELSRDLLRDEDVEVVLTTYAIASGTNKDDKRFFKKMGFQVSQCSLRGRSETGADLSGLHCTHRRLSLTRVTSSRTTSRRGTSR